VCTRCCCYPWAEISTHRDGVFIHKTCVIRPESYHHGLLFPVCLLVRAAPSVLKSVALLQSFIRCLTSLLYYLLWLLRHSFLRQRPRSARRFVLYTVASWESECSLLATLSSHESPRTQVSTVKNSYIGSGSVASSWGQALYFSTRGCAFHIRLQWSGRSSAVLLRKQGEAPNTKWLGLGRGKKSLIVSPRSGGRKPQFGGDEAASPTSAEPRVSANRPISSSRNTAPAIRMGVFFTSWVLWEEMTFVGFTPISLVFFQIY